MVIGIIEVMMADIIMVMGLMVIITVLVIMVVDAVGVVQTLLSMCPAEGITSLDVKFSMFAILMDNVGYNDIVIKVNLFGKHTLFMLFL
jgi:hypothetical protein